MSGELVTVLMPSYNHARYVEQAVRSVFDQSYRPLELVVVDDGSSDGSVEILERLRRVAPIPMRVIPAQHRGLCAALNLGVRDARGEYISVLASDDAYLPNKLELQMPLLVHHPNAPLVHADFEVIDGDGRRTGLRGDDYLPPLARGDALRGLLMLQSEVRSVTVIMRKAALLAVGGYDESLRAEDWQVFLRMAKLGPFLAVDSPVVLRRVHGENLTIKGPSRKKHFSLREDLLFEILKEVVPSDMDLESVAGLHASIAIRNAITTGAMSAAADGLRQCLPLFPSQRRRILTEAAKGVLQRAWVAQVKPRLSPNTLGQLEPLKARLAHWLRAPGR